MRDNPYDWSRARGVWVDEAVVEPTLRALRRGEGVLLVGGRGMGKSRVLARVGELMREEGCAVAFLERLPAEPGLTACLTAIGRRLGVEAEPDLGALVEALARAPRAAARGRHRRRGRSARAP